MGTSRPVKPPRECVLGLSTHSAIPVMAAAQYLLRRLLYIPAGTAGPVSSGGAARRTARSCGGKRTELRG